MIDRVDSLGNQDNEKQTQSHRRKAHAADCRRDEACFSRSGDRAAGDGVSPAAKAAASGSPPGSDAAAAATDFGRSWDSFSRQRRITRSTAGSMSSTTSDGAFVEDVSVLLLSNLFDGT